MSNLTEAMSHMLRELQEMDGEITALNEQLWTKGKMLALTQKDYKAMEDNCDSALDELLCLKNELKRTVRGREILARHEGG
jgi:hypothetical protein